ncbi:hypothetical protein ACFTAO_01400 [Paenibacillus rhizoplanae]
MNKPNEMIVVLDFGGDSITSLSRAEFVTWGGIQRASAVQYTDGED